MGNKKEEALRIIAELRGNIEFKWPHIGAGADDSIPDLLSMIDDLRDLVQGIDECHCNEN